MTFAKSRLGLVMLGGILCIGLVVAWLTIRGVNHMAWGDYTRGSIHDLAIFVDDFKEENRRFPQSVAELLEHQDSESRNVLTKVLHRRIGGFTNHYEFHHDKDAFRIVATRNGGLLRQGEMMEQRVP